MIVPSGPIVQKRAGEGKGALKILTYKIISINLMVVKLMAIKIGMKI
jgi:hypothetical protein